MGGPGAAAGHSDRYGRERRQSRSDSPFVCLSGVAEISRNGRRECRGQFHVRELKAPGSFMDKPSILHILNPLPHVSPFDITMAYDAGFDAVVPYANVTL